MWIYLFILYLVINGCLQIFFVNWVLQRNKKITMLLVEYYRKLDMGNDNHTNYES